jgi:hypothetical protein
VECDDPSFKFKVPEKPATLHRIHVTFTAPKNPPAGGKLVKTIRVRTDGNATGQTQAWAKIEPAAETATAQSK